MALARGASRVLRRLMGSVKQEGDILTRGGLGTRGAQKSTRGRIDALAASQGGRKGAITGATDEMVAGVTNYDISAAAGMTMGHQLTKLAGIGISATAVNAGISGYQDTFGDRMSGLGHFMAGLTKFGVTATAGIMGVTAIGRTAILASGRFGSKGSGAAAVNNIRNRIKSTAPGADDTYMLQSAISATRPTRRRMATREFRQRNPSGLPSGYGGQAQARHGVNRYSRRPREESMKTVRSHRQLVEGARPIGRQARSTLKTEKGIARGANLAERRLVKHESKIKQSYAMRTAAKFNTMGSIVGPVVKLPAMMAGAMVGRGSLWGKIDPAMTYMGGAMTAGTVSGLAAGAAVGITSLKRGNLRKTQEARPRPQGRSFSNINYNATLHAHRMNM